jgi:hypothetical protein
MEEKPSSEMSVYIYTTERYISEDGNIHTYRCENLISCNKEIISGLIHFLGEGLRVFWTVKTVQKRHNL